MPVTTSIPPRADPAEAVVIPCVRTRKVGIQNARPPIQKVDSVIATVTMRQTGVRNSRTSTAQGDSRGPAS